MSRTARTPHRSRRDRRCRAAVRSLTGSAAALARAIALTFCAAAVPAEIVRTAAAAGQQPDSAQQSPPAHPPPLPSFRTEVIVTPERGSEERERLPVATAVATRPDIERLPATTMADVVDSLPGFHMLLGGDSGLPPAPVSRGFFGGGEAEYVKLLVDGIPLSDPESGLVDWRRLPAFAIERVEALRGPGSAVYGDTALGGVIQVFTAVPHARYGRIALGGGSFGAHSIGGVFAQPWGRTAVDLIGSYAKTEGFRARSDLREAFTSATLRRSAGTRQWFARGSFHYRDQQDPGALSAAQLSTDRAMTDPLYDADGETARGGYGAVRFASSAGPLHYNLLGYFSGRTAERFRTLPLAPGLADRALRDISTSTGGLSIENSLDTARLGRVSHLRFGIDLSRSGVNTAYRRFDTERRTGPEIGRLVGDRWQYAGYATQSIDVGARFRVQAGVRWDGLDDRFGDNTRASHSAWSPRVGAAILVGGSGTPTTVFGQASRAFKAATVDQLFDPRPFPDFRGGTFLISNPTLEPQRGSNLEGGIRQSTRMYRWEVVLYRMSVDNEIDFDPATFTYANIGRSTHRGAEFDAVLFPGSGVVPAFQYAWTRVSPDEPGSHDLQLKNIPRHLFRPEVTATLPSAVTLHARYTWTAGAFADDGNEFPLGSRSTLDFRVAKRLRRVTARIDLLNVTGDNYEELGFTLADFSGRTVPFYYPAAGFSIRVGVELLLRPDR